MKIRLYFLGIIFCANAWSVNEDAKKIVRCDASLRDSAQSAVSTDSYLVQHFHTPFPRYGTNASINVVVTFRDVPSRQMFFNKLGELAEREIEVKFRDAAKDALWGILLDKLPQRFSDLEQRTSQNDARITDYVTINMHSLRIIKGEYPDLVLGVETDLAYYEALNFYLSQLSKQGMIDSAVIEHFNDSASQQNGVGSNLIVEFKNSLARTTFRALLDRQQPDHFIVYKDTTEAITSTKFFSLDILEDPAEMRQRILDRDDPNRTTDYVAISKEALWLLVENSDLISHIRPDLIMFDVLRSYDNYLSALSKKNEVFFFVMSPEGTTYKFRITGVTPAKFESYYRGVITAFGRIKMQNDFGALDPAGNALEQGFKASALGVPDEKYRELIRWFIDYFSMKRRLTVHSKIIVEKK